MELAPIVVNINWNDKHCLSNAVLGRDGQDQDLPV